MPAEKPKFAKIYGIVDPQTGSIIYIGKANDVKARWKTHITDARKKKSRLYTWLNEKLDKNEKVEVIELASAISEDWGSLEKIVIAQYRAEGKLLNMANGGQEPPHDPETCAKNARKVVEKRMSDPFHYEIWRMKKEMGAYLKFLRKFGEDSEKYQKVVEKLKYAAKKRPDLFGCWSSL